MTATASPVFISAAEVRAATPWPALIAALRSAFAAGAVVPPRHHHTIAPGSAAEAVLLLMPAWTEGDAVGVKIVMVNPGNAARGEAAVNATYLLSDARTGRLRAIMDGGELTARRTAAASALAADYLARPDADHLLIIGTGRLAHNVAEAHAAVRPLKRITVWGRSAEKAAAVAAAISAKTGIPALAARDLETAVAAAGMVSAVTLSRQPLVHGRWLTPGTHVDLIGGFTPEMREADDEAVRRARVYVDALDGAPREAGDILAPLRNGTLTLEAIHGDLFALCRGAAGGRGSPEEITLFKSAGHAIEDLAAARLVAAAQAGRNSRLPGAAANALSTGPGESPGDLSAL